MPSYDVAPLRGHDPEIGLLLAALNDSTREWRENLGRPSVDAIVWQSRPAGHSIGALILHIIDVELFWFQAFAAGKAIPIEDQKLLMSEEVRQYGGKWPRPPEKPISWYYDLHDRMRARSFESLHGLAPKKRYERKSYSCTLRWVVAHVVEHDSYHGGQAVLLHDLWKHSRKTRGRA